MKTCVIIGAGGRGKDAYAPYIKESGIMKIVAVAEPDEKKLDDFKRDYDIEDAMCFTHWRDLLDRERLADCAIICTQDRMHLEPAKMAIERGYHILLEKPISPDEEEINQLYEYVKDYDKTFITGYVLRYTPFIEKIKELLESGAIGKIVTMQLNENEGFWHHAHSYVRGPWANSKESSPLIVAKSCHDFDLMLYLIGSKCKSISSYGSNIYFTPENAPGKVPDRCTDGCPYQDTCKYNAISMYTQGKASYFVHKFECGNSKEAIINALKTNDYGRCVYKCGNDVCDHQVACMTFENGVTAVFTVSAFSLENNRTLKIMGTDGEIGGCMEKGEIVLKHFSDMSEDKFYVTHDGTKHCGGDSGLINHFVSLVEKDEPSYDMSVFDSHFMAFAAEKSRISGKQIEL